MLTYLLSLLTTCSTLTAFVTSTPLPSLTLTRSTSSDLVSSISLDAMSHSSSGRSISALDESFKWKGLGVESKAAGGSMERSRRIANRSLKPSTSIGVVSKGDKEIDEELLTRCWCVGQRKKRDSAIRGRSNSGGIRTCSRRITQLGHTHHSLLGGPAQCCFSYSKPTNQY